MRTAKPCILIVLMLGVVVRSEPTPYQRLEQAYAPYLDPRDPLAWPMKVSSLTADPYKFWRGSKDLYYAWARTACADWLADQASYGVTHGDLHLGNIGTYASGWGTVSFGMVDFDDSARLPVQLELLQGMITLRLVAAGNGIALDERAAHEVSREMLRAYAASFAQGAPAGQRLADDPGIRRLMARSARPYERIVDAYTDGSRLVRAITTARGKPKEILRPAPQLADAIASALARSIASDPQLGKRFRIHDAAGLRAAIRDVAWRTRIGSSGSQGLRKVLVLMDSPLVDHRGMTLLYLKQVIPSAAERSGAIPMERLPSAHRLVAHARALQQPDGFVSGWCVIDDASYWLSVKEPWSDELDPDDIRTHEALVAAARIWGTVAGAAHAAAGAPDVSGDPHLQAHLLQRSQDYVAHNAIAFAAFCADRATIEHQAAASRQIADAIHRP